MTVASVFKCIMTQATGQKRFEDPSVMGHGQPKDRENFRDWAVVSSNLRTSRDLCLLQDRVHEQAYVDKHLIRRLHLLNLRLSSLQPGLFDPEKPSSLPLHVRRSVTFAYISVRSPHIHEFSGVATATRTDTKSWNS